MTYNKWATRPLTEVVEVISGGTPKRAVPEYWGIDIPWISIQDLNNVDGRYIRVTLEGITKEGYLNSSTNILKENDIIISARGTVGKLAMISKPMAFNQSCYGIRANVELLEPNYLFYYLKNNVERVRIIGHGSVFNTITRHTLRTINITIPPLPEQKAIADTLSALDDKIELNNKINRNLEAQAQALYKHWFIDFEFPDENGNPYKSNGGEMIESELGMIPKGWEVGSLGNSRLGKLVTSGINDYEGEKIYLATADVSNTDIIDDTTFVTYDNRPSRANMQPIPNSVWFAKMKDSRKLILVNEQDNVLQDKYIFSTGFAGIRCNKLSVYYLWTYLQSDLFDTRKNALCTGTTMQAINNKNINRIKIAIPKENVLEGFNKIVKPMVIKSINIKQQNRTLSQLRDTLLPKLMSGEIRIPLDE